MTEPLHAVPEEPGESGHEQKAPNPFDTSGARLIDEPIETRRIRSAIIARSPKKTEFFRVYGHPDYVRYGIGIEFEIDGRDEVCWLGASLQNQAKSAGATPFDFLAFTVMVRPDVLMIWPQKLPKEDNRGASWHQSALEIAEIAKVHWVKKVSNRSISAYDTIVAAANWGEPEWPTETFDELLALAFKGDRLIDRPDHPVLKKLRGDDL